MKAWDLHLYFIHSGTKPQYEYEYEYGFQNIQYSLKCFQITTSH